MQIRVSKRLYEYNYIVTSSFYKYFNEVLHIQQGYFEFTLYFFLIRYISLELRISREFILEFLKILLSLAISRILLGTFIIFVFCYRIISYAKRF